MSEADPAPRRPTGSPPPPHAPSPRQVPPQPVHDEPPPPTSAVGHGAPPLDSAPGPAAVGHGAAIGGSHVQSSTNQAVSQRRGPRPLRPHANKMFCSSQKCIDDINIHIFDIDGGKYGLSGYIGTLSAMKYRQLKWSPVLVYGIPVTPIENPKTNYSSFFIIRLIDSRNPRYKVDLLIRDSDLYFMGFRRELVLTPEEEAACQDETTDEKKMDKKMKGKKAAEVAKKATKKKIQAGWGRWHEFNDKDMALPDYFNATKCGIHTSYGTEVKVGGRASFEEILTALGTFDEGYISTERLQRACYNVMVMICEASCIGSVRDEVISRILHDCAPYELDKELTENIYNWKQMGAQVLRAHLNGCMDLDEPLEKGFVDKLALVKKRKHRVKCLGDLINEKNGEVLLIKYDLSLLGYTDDEVDKIKAEARQRPTGGPAGRRELDFTHEILY